MTDAHDGLGCCGAGHTRLTAARDSATQNGTDLRRSRQRARAVLREIYSAIQNWLQDTPVGELPDATVTRRANSAITAIASDRLRRDLLGWLADRHRTTAGRAARAAHDAMRSAVQNSGQTTLSDFDPSGPPSFSDLDRERLRQVQQVDAGLLYDTEIAENLGLGRPLAQALGDRVTRQLRLGLADDESVPELAERVRAVVVDADTDGRTGMGVSGQTSKTKAELIAHDSVQDAYNSAARGRYLRNGFRLAVYDATLDTKTTDLCRRMDEVVIDIRDDPMLVPPLHPFCRSGIRPTLDADPSDAVRPADIADGFLATIRRTKSYRPPANTAGTFQPTPLTEQQGQAGR